MPSRPLRIVLIVLAVLGALVAVTAVGIRVAAHALEDKVMAALGPRAEVGATTVGWSGVVLTGVRIRSDRPHWPADDELRAERIEIAPDLRSLFGGEMRISSIRVEGGYLSVFRTRTGKVTLLPAVLDRNAGGSAPGVLPAVAIGSIELHGAAIEFFDASVRPAIVKARLERIEASLTDLRLPDLTGRSRLRIEGVHKGVARNGTLSISGPIEFSTLDAGLSLRLRNVDLPAFQPYLVKAMETGVRRGTVDLDLDATVRRHRLKAPGRLVLSGLELAPSNGKAVFSGLSRQAIVAFMKDHQDRITVHFALDGNLDDPAFSLNENFATRVAAALGETVGISVEGVVRGAGDVAGGAVKGLGTAVKKLFGR